MKEQASILGSLFFHLGSLWNFASDFIFPLKRSAGRACESKSEQYKESERRGTEYMEICEYRRRVNVNQKLVLSNLG